MGKILNLCESKLKHPVLFCLMFVVKRGRNPQVSTLTMLEMSFLHEVDKKCLDLVRVLIHCVFNSSENKYVNLWM